MTPPEILKQIQKAKETNAKVLDLSFKSLVDFPLEILELSELEELDLSNKLLSEIPEEIRNLKSLKRLNLSGCDELIRLPNVPGLYVIDWELWERFQNQISPKSITGLNFQSESLEKCKEKVDLFTHLTSLNISGNELTMIPDWMQKLTDLTSLFIGNTNLTTLPDWMQNFTHLTSFEICLNKLKTLPEWMQNLTQLTSLDISYNELTTLPDWMQKLTHLTSLNIGYNQLTMLPDGMQKLTQLTSLFIRNNQLTTLPDWMKNLIQLTWLDIGENNLATLPDWMQNLTQLTWLDIGEIHLTTFPDWMQNLTNLTSLDIRGNSLRTLPDWMQNLTNLTSLDIRSNSLRTLPDWIIQLPNLTSLHADKNSFSSPLREITSEFNSLPGLKEYFRLRKQTVKNKEARLILIGNGEVGKTSVLERLKDNTFREKPSTHGIQHIIWDNFQLPLEHVPEIRLHVWDFAGQEFYHSTHRFFLKTRALFLLVWSADNQEKVLNEPESETEFPLEYWLDKISGLSNHSPIIIVQNKTDAKKMILEKQKEYSEKYNVIDFIDFSAIKDKGSNREKLLELITEVFTNPELMGKEIGWELPLVWHHVKVDLETIAKTRNFISYSEFLELCGKEELNSNSAKILCEFLHNLGTILYLGDYQNQESMVILNQVWSAELAYKFIKNKKFIESEGRFNKEDISKLDDFKSPKEADEFINILTNLELCFKKDYTKEEYIIPTLLPEDKPKHFDLMFRESLHPALLFKFPLYLHRGIMERFIARFGKYADEKTPIWRNGILIVKDDIRVLVEANRKEKVISISFQKDQASGRLLKEIYGSFNNIISDSVQELIPCTCPKCKSNPDGHEFPLAKLTKAYTEKKPLQCEKSLDLVSLSDLIPLDFFVREFADNKNFPDNQESISVLQIQEEKEKKEMERKENKAKRKSSKRKEIRTVLHISSNAADKVKIEHEKEINTIKNVFNSYPEKYTFNSEIDIERKGLSNVLTNNNPYFLQISTHGSTEGLIFKNLEPDQQLVTPKNLLKMVEKKSIQLILFSACHSFEIASALSKTIPYTIGFQGDIDQRITEIFSEAFYCKFIETENILDSFQAGKDALEMNYSPTEDNPEPEKAVKLFKNGEPHEFL